MFLTDPPILAIDVANMAYRAIHRFGHLTTAGKRMSGHVFGVTKMLLTLRKRWPGAEFRFALEGKPARRLKLYPEYKGNRPEKDRTPYHEIVELVKRFPGATYRHPRLEADDVLAILTHPVHRGDRQVIVVSKDQDLWKFVGRKNILVYYGDHIVHPMEVETAYQVPPKAVPLYKAIFGDSSDNLKPSVARLSKKAVCSVISDHGVRNPKQLRAALDHLPEKTASRIRDSWDVLERNWQVVRLPTRPMDVVSVAGPRSPKKLVAYLEEFECKSLYDTVTTLWGTK